MRAVPSIQAASHARGYICAGRGWQPRIAGAVLLALAFPAGASAAQLAVHDDQALTGLSRSLWFDRAQQLGAGSVRGIVYGPRDLGRTDLLVDQANRRRMGVQLALHWTSWKLTTKFREDSYLRFVKQAVRRYPTVARFSLLNEPDLTLPPGPTACRTVTKWVAHRQHFRRWRYRRATRPRLRRLGLYRRRHIHNGTRHTRRRIGTRKQTVWTRYGHSLWHRKRRRAGVYTTRLYRESDRLCGQLSKGAVYRDLYRKGYAAIKSVNPKAQVLFGEQSPNSIGFVRQALCLDPTTGDCSPIYADGFAHHPYQWSSPPEVCDRSTTTRFGGVGCTGQWLQLLHDTAAANHLQTVHGKPVPLYYTEYGYLAQGRNRFEAMPEVLKAKWAVRTMRFVGRFPVRSFVWYQLAPTGTPQGEFAGNDIWDTSLWSATGPRPIFTAIREEMAK